MGKFDLTGQVALITGGAGGIGRAVAQSFGDAGATIVLGDINSDASEKAAAELEELGFPAVGLGGDVSKSEDAEALVAGTVEAFGRIDILVNIAGYMGRTAPLWELTDDDWQDVMNIDLTSVFYVSRAAIKHMRSQGSGAIISISSIAGKEGTPRLDSLLRCQSRHHRFHQSAGERSHQGRYPRQLRGAAIVDTPLLDQLPKEAIDLMLSKAPMGRFGTADEVAAVVHFLASDAASFITAQCFDASGGRATY